MPAFALLILAVFTCIAILRYRLYDLDLLINRTLVYGTLSAGVAGIYARLLRWMVPIFSESTASKRALSDGGLLLQA